jgi:ParB-like chromosome segregation protein Spo0J
MSGSPSRGVQPYSRRQFNRALITNALVSPFNVGLLAAMLIAGILLGVIWLMIPVAIVVYVAAAVRTYFDEDVAQKVLERERQRRRAGLKRGERIDVRRLAPPIASLVQQAREREGRVRSAIAGAELPYEEVSTEVDGFVDAVEGTAARAQLLWDALADSPPQAVEQRLGQVQGDPARAELTDALRHQLEVGRRMEGQLGRFFDEMERVLVELDTVRGNLVSVSASTEAANQQRLAAEVRGLREETVALSEGMSEAFEEPRPASP